MKLITAALAFSALLATGVLAGPFDTGQVGVGQGGQPIFFDSNDGSSSLTAAVEDARPAPTQLPAVQTTLPAVQLTVLPAVQSTPRTTITDTAKVNHALMRSR